MKKVIFIRSKVPTPTLRNRQGGKMLGRKSKGKKPIKTKA